MLFRFAVSLLLLIRTAAALCVWPDVMMLMMPPADASSSHICVYMTAADGLWYWTACDSTLNYICQKQAARVQVVVVRNYVWHSKGRAMFRELFRVVFRAVFRELFRAVFRVLLRAVFRAVLRKLFRAVFGELFRAVFRELPRAVFRELFRAVFRAVFRELFRVIFRELFSAVFSALFGSCSE